MSHEWKMEPSGSARETARALFRRVRSVLETPILDERKWAKLPEIPADAYIIDLEDSVVPSRKLDARRRAVEFLGRPEHFRGRPVIARPNNLATPWGRADVAALVDAGATLLAYPKPRSAAEIDDVVDIVTARGATVALFPIIETAGALLEVREIARHPAVAGLFTGIGDLSVDAGVAFYDAGGVSEPLVLARTLVSFAAAAYGRSATDTLFVRDIRDRAEAEAMIVAARGAGFTSLATFYPPHVEIVNRLMRPQRSEVEEASATIARYEAAQAEGKPAVLLDDGRTILMLDYQRARNVVAAAGDVPEGVP